MNHTRSTASPRSSRAARRPAAARGLSIIELLISLAIAGALLTATAAALNASVNAYAVNQEQAMLMQQARIALHRIATAIRVAEVHAPEDTALAASFASGYTVIGTSIAMLDEAGNDLVFRYDAPSRQLLFIRNSTPHVLARGVEAFTVQMEPMRSTASIKTGGGWDLLRRASVLITVRTTAQTALSAETTGQQTLTLSAAVAPRRNAW